MNESSFRQVLKNRYFLLLWFAQIFSQLADKIFFLLMVFLITKDQFSNSSISVLTLVFTIPAVFFGSIAGVFVDRWNKKSIMIISNIFRTIFVLILPFSDHLFYLYLITFLVSTLTQFFAPAETSMIPSIVEKKDLLPANSLFMGTMLASLVLGFALGAPIISRFDGNVTGFAIAAMYAFSAFLLIYIKVAEKPIEKKGNQESFFKEFKEGLAYVIKTKIILFSLIRLIIIFSAFAALSVLAIGFVNDVLYLKPVFFGYLLALAGMGMALGAIFSSKFGNKIGKEKLVFAGFILTGVFLIIIACTNQIASLVGLEKITQQKELYNSLNTLNDNGENSNVIIDLKTFLAPDDKLEPQINSHTKISQFSNEQLNSLANLTGLESRKLKLLKSDEKTKKLSIGNLMNKCSNGEIKFLTSKNNSFFIAENKDIAKIVSHSMALKFFLKLQNIYIYKNIFNSVNLQNKVLNSIFTLTGNDIENITPLREFVKLNDNGYPTFDLSTKIEKLNLTSLGQLANLLSIELEDLSYSEIQNLSMIDYLNDLIKNGSSDITIKKAEALKNFLSISKTPVIKILLKKESSLFELLFALTVVTLVGFSAALCVIPLQTILQEIVEESMRGKVFGVQNMAVNTAMTIPMVLAGVAADLLDGKIFNLKGVPVVMILTGLIILIGGLVERALKPKLGPR